MGHTVPLLESFPVPPSFLPPSSGSSRAPSTTPFQVSLNGTTHDRSSSPGSSHSHSPTSSVSNPPPSLPPSGPLPPVPGRSRISGHEAAFFMQSRRTSKYSINSSHSGSGGYDRPDSVASFASARSNGASYTYGSGSREDLRDFKASTSGRAKAPEVQIISEDVEDTSQAYGGMHDDEPEFQLTRLQLSISPMPPSPTGSDVDDIPTSFSAQFPTPPPLSPFAYQQANAIRRASSSTSSLAPMSTWSLPPSPMPRSPLLEPRSAPPPQRAGSPSPDESLADISMHDLPSADDGAESDWDVPTTKPLALRSKETRRVSGAPPPSSFTGDTLPPRSDSRSSLRRTHRISVGDLDSASLKATIVSPPLSPNPPKSPKSPPPVASAPPAPPISLPPTTNSPPPLASAPSFSSTGDSELDIHRALHREVRSARSRSRNHRQRLGLGSDPNSPLQSPPLSSASTPRDAQWPPMPPMPASEVIDERPQPRRKGSQMSDVMKSAEVVEGMDASVDSNAGRASPDIQNLLEQTPRPRRSQSRKRARSSAGTSRHGSMKGSMRRRKSDYSVDGDDWDDFGLIKGRGRNGAQRQLRHAEDEEARMRKLERQLDGVGSSSEGEDGHRDSYGSGFGFGGGESDEGLESDASDSSLDLHTPLPNLMLRDGLLSPNSKLLPVDSLASLAGAAGGYLGTPGAARPDSTLSMVSNAGSVQTKSGIFKDTRDTPSRRLRHKDGKLLKGGIGLTTGLGWSDSEDEDAPSPLTRRLSSLNISRKSSSLSLRSEGSGSRSKSYGNLRASASMSSASRSTRASTFSSGSRSNFKPLPRSYSSRTLDTDLDELEEISEFGEMNGTSSRFDKMRYPPPTSRSASKRSAASSSSSGLKSLRSSSSTLSLKTSLTGDRTPRTTSAVRSVRSASEASTYSSASSAAGNASRADELATLTPSSNASSVSIPLPVTPRDDDLDTPTPSLIPNFDKVLPPLPNPKTGSIRRPSGATTVRKPSLRKRSLSSSSSGHPKPFNGSDIPVPTIPSTISPKSYVGASASAHSTPQPPRQLQLPRQSASTTNINGQLPVPVPGVGGGPSRLRLPSGPSVYMSRTAPSTPTTPSSPESANKPRSRTGTGMTYRTTSSSKSGMRLPSGQIPNPIVGPRF